MKTNNRLRARRKRKVKQARASTPKNKPNSRAWGRERKILLSIGIMFYIFPNTRTNNDPSDAVYIYTYPNELPSRGNHKSAHTKITLSQPRLCNDPQISPPAPTHHHMSVKYTHACAHVHAQARTTNIKIAIRHTRKHRILRAALLCQHPRARYPERDSRKQPGIIAARARL